MTKKTLKKIIISINLFSIMLILSYRSIEIYGGNGLIRYPLSIQYATDLEDYYKTTSATSYRSNVIFEPSLRNLQCPIPYKDRVKNHTGKQSVFSALETLGRWAEEIKITNPPLTSREECKSYSSPSEVENLLNELRVDFTQIYGNKEKGLELIKKSMKERKGVLWSVPGHAMVLVHYSEKENRVCYIDSSDKKLRIQQTSIQKFNEKWTSWVVVINGNEDLISKKINKNLFLK